MASRIRLTPNKQLQRTVIRHRGRAQVRHCIVHMRRSG